MKFIQTSPSRYIKVEAVTCIYDQGNAEFRLIVDGAEIHVNPKFADYVRTEFGLADATAAVARFYAQAVVPPLVVEINPAKKGEIQ